MDEMFAIKCQNCGGPMYSHQAKRSFECAYCETVIPWQADAGEPKSALGIRHTPLTVVDGLLKLTHVSQLERPEDPDWYFFNSYWRNQSVLEHLLWEDRGTAQEFQEATHVSIPCPFCGASFEGESTQRVFECPSCGNKIGMADLLKPGTFSKRLTMGVGAEYVPEQGVPCEISPQQARANALQLVRQYPDAFAGHDVEDAIQNDMMLFYFPMALADLRMMASFPGKGLSKETLVYYEVLDWAYPRANYLDVHLMGILEPWDFGKVGSFDPAMQEGDFRVVSVDASTKDQVIIDKLALDIVGNDAEAVLGLNKKSIRAWARKARKHKDGLVMVPVYFVDRPASDSRDGEQVRIAVNGRRVARPRWCLATSAKRISWRRSVRVCICPVRAAYTPHPSRSNMLNRRSYTRSCAVETASNRARLQPPSRVPTERRSPNARACSLRSLVSRGVLPGRRAASQGHETNLRLLGTCYHCR